MRPGSKRPGAFFVSGYLAAGLAEFQKKDDNMARSRTFCLSLASLAFMALTFLAAPSFATDRGGTEFMAPVFDVYVVAVDVDKMFNVAVLPAAESLSPGKTAHDQAYTIQNQPNSTWRIAADAYSHINPHILTA